MKAHFQLADESLIPALLEMMADFNEMYGYPMNTALTHKNLQAFIATPHFGRIWAINTEAGLVGYVVLAFGFSFEHKGRDAFIDELYLREGFRGKGLGRKTLEFVAEEGKNLGIKVIHLEVEKYNLNASKLYLSMGFKDHNRSLLSKSIS